MSSSLSSCACPMFHLLLGSTILSPGRISLFSGLLFDRSLHVAHWPIPVTSRDGSLSGSTVQKGSWPHIWCLLTGSTLRRILDASCLLDCYRLFSAFGYIACIYSSLKYNSSSLTTLHLAVLFFLCRSESVNVKKESRWPFWSSLTNRQLDLNGLSCMEIDIVPIAELDGGPRRAGDLTCEQLRDVDRYGTLLEDPSRKVAWILRSCARCWTFRATCKIFA